MTTVTFLRVQVALSDFPIVVPGIICGCFDGSTDATAMGGNPYTTSPAVSTGDCGGGGCPSVWRGVSPSVSSEHVASRLAIPDRISTSVPSACEQSTHRAAQSVGTGLDVDLDERGPWCTRMGQLTHSDCSEVLFVYLYRRPQQLLRLCQTLRHVTTLRATDGR